MLKYLKNTSIAIFIYEAVKHGKQNSQVKDLFFQQDS